MRANPEPPMTPAEVAAFLSIHRTSLYRNAAIQACRVKVPGLRVARYDRAKVYALLRGKAA